MRLNEDKGEKLKMIKIVIPKDKNTICQQYISMAIKEELSSKKRWLLLILQRRTVKERAKNFSSICTP